MKEKTKNKIKSWSLTFAFAGLVSLFAFGTSMKNYYSQTLAYSSNETYMSFELTQTELENNTFSHFYNCFTTIETETSFAIDDVLNIISFEQVDYTFDQEIDGGWKFADGDDMNNVWFIIDYEDFNSAQGATLNENYKFVYFDTVLNDYSDSFRDGISLELYDPGTESENETIFNIVNSAFASDLGLDVDVSMTSILGDFISILVGGIVQLAEGIATGIVSMATSLFIDSGSLSTFGGIMGIFAGLALAVGITTKVYTWVTSLGN